MKKKLPHVHFMGIGGSGMSAVAMIAKSQGYVVSGCDLQQSTPYLDKLKKEKVQLLVGHDKDHIKDVDILTVTAAAFYQNKNHPEMTAGKDKKLMQWQEFMGKYLQKGKRTICITGTHGKSTTTTMVGLLYEAAGNDPTVEIGAKSRKWKSNYRIGASDIFINEADEFYGNFLHYYPDTIILNNIEFDHPDYFKSEDHVVETFEKFIGNLKDSKTLIINQDSKGNSKLLKKLGTKKLKKLKITGYTFKSNPIIALDDSFVGEVVSRSKEGTKFRVKNIQRSFDEKFLLKLPGDFNVSNALGVIALSVLEGIEVEVTKSMLRNLSGTSRRMELIGEKNGIKVYDDYAHHPTEIRATLSGLRQMYPKNNIICVVEPHMFSRTKILLHDYRVVFGQADTVFIAPIFKSRDTEDYGVSEKSIANVSDHDDIHAFNSFEKVIKVVVEKVKKNDVVVVMGAGKSYKLARDILESI